MSSDPSWRSWGTVDGYTIVEIRPSLQGDLRSRLYDEGSLNASRIVSPNDGVAGIARAKPGNSVGGETVLTTVASVDPIKVLFYVGEEEYARLHHLSRGGLVRTSSFRRRERETLEIILSDGSVYPHRDEPPAPV